MNVLNVAFKDLRLLVRDRGQLVLLFLVPIGFILAFSVAFAAGRQLDEKLIALPVVNQDPDGEMSKLLLERLDDGRGVRVQSYDQTQAEADLEEGTIGLLLVVPSNFSQDVHAGTPTTLSLLYGRGAVDSEVQAVRLVVNGVAADLSLEAQLVGGLSQMAAMMSDAPPDVQAFTAERIKLQAESQFERAKESPLVGLTARWPNQIANDGDDSGSEDFAPSTFGVAGFAILFAFLTAQATAMSIFEEKRDGTFRRLLGSPLGKRDIVLGKMLPNFLIALLQISIIVGASLVLLPLIGLEAPSLGSSPAGLVLVTIVVALCSTSLGIFLAALCRTETQVGGISSLALWVAGMVGGAFIPSFVLGEFLNTVGKVVPHYWALQAYNDLMIRAQGVADIVPELGVLAAFTAVFFAIGLLRFSFD